MRDNELKEGLVTLAGELIALTIQVGMLVGLVWLVIKLVF